MTETRTVIIFIPHVPFLSSIGPIESTMYLSSSFEMCLSSVGESTIYVNQMTLHIIATIPESAVKKQMDYYYNKLRPNFRACRAYPVCRRYMASRSFRPTNHKSDIQLSCPRNSRKRRMTLTSCAHWAVSISTTKHVFLDTQYPMHNETFIIATMLAKFLTTV